MVAALGSGNNIQRLNRSGKYVFNNPTTSLIKGTIDTDDGFVHPFPNRISITTVTFSVQLRSNLRSKYIATAKAYVDGAAKLESN
mmetsp:Transcript_58940/g.87531  ORF Transcript_58940/g.87531 Transcript_58940/m.87531 type:complete len:85 (+) Transcript_58940:496-750(+)